MGHSSTPDSELQTPNLPEPLEFLFDLPAGLFVSFAGELRRLGVRRFSSAWVGDESHQRILIRVENPPYYVLARASDEENTVRAYRKTTDNRWDEAGSPVPTEKIAVPEGNVLLRGADGESLLLPSPEWQPTLADVPLKLPETPFRSPAKVRGKLALNLKLTSLREADAPELWVVRGDAQAQLRPLIAVADERTLERFQIAVVRRGESESLLLRAVKAKGPQPIWLLPGTAFRSYLKLPNLFLPCRMRLETVPRRDTLREVFGLDRDVVVWLEPAGGGFRVESVPVKAFQPLRQWVAFESPQKTKKFRAEEIAPFAGFESFAVSESKSKEKPKETPVPTEPKKPKPITKPERGPGIVKRFLGWVGGVVPRLPRGRGREETDSPPESITVESAVRSAIRPMEDRLKIPDASRVTMNQEQLSALEGQFLESLSNRDGSDHTVREGLWERLAPAYERTENYPDAILCWINAVWSRDRVDEFTSTLAYGWFRAEATHARLPHENIDLSRWLAHTPRPESVRALAAYACWAASLPAVPRTLLDHLDEVQAMLEINESWLPLRAAWLTRSALTKLSRGDILGVARTRDRLMDRLQREGLSIDLDTPSFLRFASEGVSQRFQYVRDWIIKKREPIHEWIKRFNTGGQLQKFGYDAEVQNTQAYVELLLAWGLARFGEHQTCERLRGKARQILDLNDPVHSFLHAAFEYRIQQVREGKTARGDLPAELHSQFRERLATLPPDPRGRAEYAVEKLLQFSEILQPNDKVDAYWKTTYLRAFQGSSIPKQLDELTRLDGPPLNEAVSRLLIQARAEAATVPMWMVVAQLLNVVSRLDEKVAHDVLSRLPAAVEEVNPKTLPKLLERGMFAAAHFNDQSLIKALASNVLKMSEKKWDRETLNRVEQLASGTFRAFSRLGMKLEVEKFLSQRAEWVLRGESFPVARRRFGKEWPLALRILLPVAAGWYYNGLEEQAYTIVELAGKDLYTVEMTSRDRTDLALSYASTLGQLPVKIALGRFEEMFQRLSGIQVKSTTNTHFTLSILQLVETVVVAMVHPDFQLGPGVRRWLDEDEFEVRKRIHRDLQASGVA